MSGGSAMSSGRPLRAGVIGTGMIAQLTHLRYLAELPELYEVATVCDLGPENARACAEQYGIPLVHTDWRTMLAEPLDVVFVLTSGSHAPMAIAAAAAGLHVFVEKPMCFSAAEGAEMIAAADAAGVTLMVGYPKRYDPAYAQFLAEAAGAADARLLRVTTMESPFRPYIGHHLLRRSAPLAAEVAAGLAADADARITAAIGSRRDLSRAVYQNVLIDTLVHELSAVRGVLGEPDWLDFADLREEAVTVALRFGDTRAVIHWLDLPGIARYQMEFALFAPGRRVTLTFPSPYLRNEPAALVVEGGEAGTARSWRRDEVISYADAFKLELEEFWRCVANGTRPATSGADGLADVALCQSIVECHRTGEPVARPAAAR
jgi:predicted dehydrogenase